MLMNGSCWGPTGPLAEFLILILGGCYTLCRNEPLSSSRFHEDVLCCYCLFFGFLLVSRPFYICKKKRCSLVIFEFLANNHYSALIISPVLVWFGLKLPHSAKLPLPFSLFKFLYFKTVLSILLLLFLLFYWKRDWAHMHMPWYVCSVVCR